MYILTSWKDALSMLRPKNLSFLLGSFWLTLSRTYRALFRGGWLPLLVITTGFAVQESFSEPTWYRLGMINALWYGLWFTILLAIRPSVEQKSSDYFYHCSFYFLPFCLGLLVIRAIVGLISGQGFALIGTEDIYWTPLDITTFAGPLYLTPALIFFALFYLDSGVIDGSETGFSWLLSAFYSVFKSLWRSMKLLVVTFPLTLFFYILLKHSIAWFYQALILRLYAVEWLGSLYLGLMEYGTFYQGLPAVIVRILDALCAVVLWPIAIVPFAILYIKWIHERFSFFFDAR